MAVLSPGLLLIDPVFLSSLAGGLAIAWWLRRHIGVAPAIWPAAAIVAAAAAAMPHVLASTWGMDYRLPLVLAMLWIGGTSLPAGAFWRPGALAALVCLIVARSADTFVALREIGAEIAETRTILAGLPAGARLLTVNTGGHGTGFETITASTIWHMPLTAVIDHDAFVPTLFSGLTTVQIRPEFRRASTPNGLPISPGQLREGAMTADPAAEPGDGRGARLYHLGWPKKFDYVLIQRYGLPAGELPRILREVATSENLTLYAVTPP